jgi:amidase
VGADPGRLRIGVRSEAFGRVTTTHPDCVAAADEAGRLLESLGHTVVAADLPALDEADYLTHFLTHWSAGTAWNLDHWSSVTGHDIGPDDVEPSTWAIAEAGRAIGASQWLTAREWLQRHARRVQAWWAGGFDLLLTPTLAEPPPPLGEFDSPPDNPLHGLFRAGELVPFTPVFNVTGQPAISLPLHWNDAGLPIGVHLVAAFGREDLLVRVASQLEAARPWAARRPAVHA